jgi:uncharacterized Zn finger protein (UPF0148 family)
MSEEKLKDCPYCGAPLCAITHPAKEGTLICESYTVNGHYIGCFIRNKFTQHHSTNKEKMIEQQNTRKSSEAVNEVRKEKMIKAISDVLHDHVELFEDCPLGIEGHFGKEKNYVAEKIAIKINNINRIANEKNQPKRINDL